MTFPLDQILSGNLRGSQGVQGIQGPAGSGTGTGNGAQGIQGIQGTTGATGAVVYDAGTPTTDFSVGININCGGVT